MTNKSKNFKDDELVKEFQSLVVELGKDVTRNHVSVLVRDEFNRIKNEQDKLLKQLRNNVKKMNADISTILKDTSSEIIKQKDSISALNKLNDEFIEKLKLYLEDNNVISMTEELINYSKSFNDYIKNITTYSRHVQEEIKNYNIKINNILNSLDKKTVDTNNLLKDISEKNKKINIQLNNIANEQKNELKKLLESIFTRIGKSDDKIHKKMTLIIKESQQNILKKQSDLANNIKELDENIRDNHEVLTRIINELAINQEERYEETKKMLTQVEEQNEHISSELKAYYEKGKQMLIGLLILGGINIIFLINIFSSLK